MKTFENQAFQGDVAFIRVADDAIPADAEKAKDLVVAHSETGHHHAFPTDANVERFTTSDPFTAYLKVATESVLLHHREFDTHAPIVFKPGTYMVRRQREHTPEGFRQIQD